MLPSTAHVVLSTRRDADQAAPARLADEVAEIRAGDLQFTEHETRELLSTSGINLSGAGAAALHQRTEGWAAGLRLAVISLGDLPGSERFVAESRHRQGDRGEPHGRDARARPSQVQRNAAADTSSSTG